MPMSPGFWQEDNSLDFRAPPPSPIATGHRSSFANDFVLAEFLRNSLQVPELVLPDKIVPAEKLDETPPKIDLKLFNSSECDVYVSKQIKCVGRIGCFELINHGISDDLIKEVMDAARGVFDLSRKEKDTLRKSAVKILGFEEKSGLEEDEIMGEEFAWSRDADLMLKLEGISSRRYLNFSAKMEVLSSSIEKVAYTILQHLEQQSDSTTRRDRNRTQAVDSVCRIYKHNNLEDMTLDDWARALRYDAIRMLIRGSDCSHVLGIHICNGCSEFHIYSKKGWVSFVPQKNSLIITLGDQIQAWSGRVQKHVLGKAVFFKGDHIHNMSDNISMAFLYSPFPNPNRKKKLGDDDEVIITLGQQVYFAILLALAYQFLVFFCSLF